MIWLFGSYARGDFINDRRVDEYGVVSEYNSDVDILVVIRGRSTAKKTKRVKKMIDQIEDCPDLKSEFHVIYESQERLNEGLTHSEYFYLDVVEEGIVLFNDEMELNEPHKLDPKQRRHFAVNYFEEVYLQSCKFQKAFEIHYQDNTLDHATFNLHQMTEQLFYSYLLVHSHYKSRTHKLHELRTQVIVLTSDIKDIFPFKTKEQRTLFGFFGDAYIKARYRQGYVVDPDDLDTIIEWVATFQRWVYQECLNKIDGFIPELNYSNDQTLPYRFVDLNELKTTPLPQVMVAQQRALLAKKDEALVLKDEELEESLNREKSAIEREEQALSREEKEIVRREQAEIEKKEALKQLEQERVEKAELLKQLRDAGLQ
jgi:predicted nucleotidyltransferase